MTQYTTHMNYLASQVSAIILSSCEINESYHSIFKYLDQADITSAIYLLKTCVEKGIVSASKALEAKPFKVLKYVGNGYEYPIQGSLTGASAEVRYAAGLYQGHSQGEC